jgi:hypothetical protein
MCSYSLLPALLAHIRNNKRKIFPRLKPVNVCSPQVVLKGRLNADPLPHQALVEFVHPPHIPKQTPHKQSLPPYVGLALLGPKPGTLVVQPPHTSRRNEHLNSRFPHNMNRGHITLQARTDVKSPRRWSTGANRSCRLRGKSPREWPMWITAK